VSAALAPLALAVLRRARVLDHPSARSSHSVPVLRGGGVAPGLAAVASLALTATLRQDPWRAVALVAVVFGLIGLLDDVVGIRALHRLALQFVAALGAAAFLLSHLTGPVAWRGVAVAGSVFWLVGFVNAYNFMDGIDGISVAQAVGAGTTWVVVGTIADRPALAAAGAVIAGAALGFAPFNVPRARMFLGDVGSYFIGAWLAAVAVLALRSGVPPEAVLAPLALYVADTGSTLVRRVTRGERWYLPHRDHAYQRLVAADWSHLRTSAVVAACVAACGALGAVSLGDSYAARVGADVVIAGIVGAYLLAPRLLARPASDMAVA